MTLDRARHLAAVAVLALARIGSMCSSGDRPMAPDEVVAVIVDLHLADARSELVDDVANSLRDSVLAQHGITASQFEKAIGYYVDRPEEYISIYNRAIDSLSAEEASLEEAGVIGMLPPP